MWKYIKISYSKSYENITKLKKIFVLLFSPFLVAPKFEKTMVGEKLILDCLQWELNLKQKFVSLTKKARNILDFIET